MPHIFLQNFKNREDGACIRKGIWDCRLYSLFENGDSYHHEFTISYGI